MSELPLCACVWAADPDATRDALVALAGRAALVELRLDRVAPDYPVGPVIGAAPLPVLATCRPPREGGAWSGDEGARLALLQRAVDAGARWVDLEWDVDPGAVVGALRLRSRHVFEPTAPASFDALLASLGAGDLGKLAVAVEGAEQALELLERAARVRPCPLVVALGPDGVAARVLGPSYGQPWTYAAHDPRDPTGPGQLDLTGLTRLWRGGRARAEAAYGVVGSPVGHSRSPALFNHLFAELGVDALYSWLQTADPQALWNRCAADPRWRGFSVTTPHKQAAAAWARARGTLSPAAEATGAVNTLSRAGDAWRADNTDARALRELLAPAGLSGRDARVLGSGGAARAAAWALRELGARVTVHARSPERGARLAAALGVRWGGAWGEVSGAGPHAIVHATTVGMHGGPDPTGALLPAEAFTPGSLLYELVYTPRETPLCARARARGARVIDGVAHFAAQARAQLASWCPALEVDDARWARLFDAALEA